MLHLLSQTARAVSMRPLQARRLLLAPPLWWRPFATAVTSPPRRPPADGDGDVLNVLDTAPLVGELETGIRRVGGCARAL